MLLVRGKVRVKDDRIQLICDQVEPYAVKEQGEMAPPAGPAAEPSPAPRQQVSITLTQTDDESRDTGVFNQTLDLLRRHPGAADVYLTINSGTQVRHFRLPVTVQPSPELRDKLAELVGQENVDLQE